MKDWLNIDIASIIALVIAISSFVRAWRMTPHEESASDANAVSSYAEAADKATERADKLTSRLADVEGRLDIIIDENRRLREENREYLAILTNWAQGIMILETQIKANQLTAGWLPRPQDIKKFQEKDST